MNIYQNLSPYVILNYHATELSFERRYIANAGPRSRRCKLFYPRTEREATLCALSLSLSLFFFLFLSLSLSLFSLAGS